MQVLELMVLRVEIDVSYGALTPPLAIKKLSNDPKFAIVNLGSR